MRAFGRLRRKTALTNFPLGQAARPAWPTQLHAGQSTESWQYSIRNTQASGSLWHGGLLSVIRKSTCAQF